MPEIRRTVAHIEVDRVCEECQIGLMRPIGTVLCSYPPQYPHECDYCGALDIFDKRYPYIESK